MKPRLIKIEEVEKVVKTQKVVGVSDHIAKELAVALLTGEYAVTDWQSVYEYGQTSEKIELNVKGVSLTIKS
ncbi:MULTISPECIES: hypothetical protein [Bacillus subtilis group]|uniref:hypothetical protein n=1 Tax=Bacillus subtilis group TaxID=653685 RepID=UPI0011BEFD52|nr:MULTISPECIES: hypothetical protein [Bacillus subtilis group]UAY71954.1 hypothetical protein K8336_07915 [Bacillus paralicheniformis]